jgi:penicillin-binding protein 1C
LRAAEKSSATKLHQPTSNQQPQLLSARTAFWITDILSDANAREYAFGSGGSLDFPFPVAVKTGTSQAYRDNWTIGYTRDVTVGVWVGNFDRQPLRGSSGVTGAAPIFTR